MSTSPLRIFIGFSGNEIDACNIARHSLLGTTEAPLDIQRISRLLLWDHYYRPTQIGDDDRLWDVISNAPMSTDHAIARFFVPYLCHYEGWALFTDGDILCRHDIVGLFERAEAQYAVMCVQHPPLRAEGYKKDGALQVAYPRKNWSSVMLFNCNHPANQALSLDALNSWTGRDLHGFTWLRDREIGALPPAWNYLVGVNPPMPDPSIVHFTQGIPRLAAHAHDPFADEWYAYAQKAGYTWARPVMHLEGAG